MTDYTLGLQHILAQLQYALNRRHLRTDPPGCRYCGVASRTLPLCETCTGLLTRLSERFPKPIRVSSQVSKEWLPYRDDE